MLAGINHITLAVKNIDQAFAFYRNVLGFKPLVKWDKGAYFLINNFWFCLNVDENCKPDCGYTHYAFSVTKENFAAMAQKITASGAKIFKENTSPEDSLYFLDPDGHKLEIHIGDFQSRITAKKNNIGAWNNVEWFV
jgi:catechol 2,3-dioxygenase-like lactoylglutathione lyase family enzyme